MKAKKKFGQNFLKDEVILDKIIAVLKIALNDLNSALKPTLNDMNLNSVSNLDLATNLNSVISEKVIQAKPKEPLKSSENMEFSAFEKGSKCENLSQNLKICENSQNSKNAEFAKENSQSFLPNSKNENFLQENSQISQSEEFTENFSQNSQNAVKIVEIGLGLGDLTQKLLEFSQNFNAQCKANAERKFEQCEKSTKSEFTQCNENARHEFMQCNESTKHKFERCKENAKSEFTQCNKNAESKFTQCEKTQNAKNAKSKFTHNKSGAKCGKMAVVGYEIDSDLIPILEAKFQKQLENQHLVLRCEDASLRRSLDDEPYILVANLPYYIATRLILQAFEDRNCTAILVMVQKEVALKFCAKSAESEFCALSVLAELLCERKFLFEVPPNSFIPPPNVDSAVIFLRKKQQNLGDLHAFKAFLRACFKAPRKQLLTNLRSQKGRILPVFSRRNLRENVRPHELCVDDFLEIFEIIKDSYEQDERGREKQQTLPL